ncbi:hypothetical protein [Paraburkholderia elongata]|uniref:Lipoprotein n=1 Tax=Paraburkholderia elongata TaxID=2675747 RepID=A0A972NMB9_9BURK|nr:hypothetical protein [Paraburkholderia elongata]NPT54904.1 hypothetical protein [Paraburkholderia elongata]NPT60933.1 hypothetical protein [Paraburkholderia elongata]
MKRSVAVGLLAGLLAGCSTQMQQQAQQDRETFEQCRRAHPDTWGDNCNAELNVYYTSANAAQAESANNAQKANAFGAAVLGTGLAVLGAAAAAQESRQYCWYDRWGREWCRYY